MNKRNFIGLSVIIASTIGLISLRACQTKRDVRIASKILAPDVAEKIIINPNKHTLVIISNKGTEALSLPDHTSSIEVLKSGKLRLTVPHWGYEVEPFIGIGYSTQLNDYIGADFFYWKRLDLGAAFGFDRNLKIKALDFPVILSYTVYHRLRLSIGVEPFGEHSVNGLISVRI